MLWEQRKPGPGDWGRAAVPDPEIIRRCRARWWEVQPERVTELEGPSFGLDPTLRRLGAGEIRRNQDLHDVCRRLGVEAEDLLAYQALADGPFGRYRVAAVFPLPPDKMDPLVLCLDGPRGQQASLHRNGDAILCLYYKDDPPERRWRVRDRLIRLFGLARQHLACEYIFRKTGNWPINEAPHGETTPAHSDPSKALPPIQWPRRNRACPCDSGRKAKRCCFQ